MLALGQPTLAHLSLTRLPMPWLDPVAGLASVDVDGELTMSRPLNSVSLSIGSSPRLYWGLAEESGMVLFQTSADAMTGATHTSIETTTVQKRFQAFFTLRGVPSTSGTTSFDMLNGLP